MSELNIERTILSNIRRTKDPVERFMSFVEPEPNTGCWLWGGGCFENGYGKFRIGSKMDNTTKTVKAHRFSYETFVSAIPKEVKVLHKCDNPPCVNWEHLFLGTIQDNCNDMFLKGRGVKSKKGLPYGVTLLCNNKFRSQIRFNDKLIYLGNFDSIEEASKAAIGKKLELLGVLHNEN